ncbi:Uma2 family endonuclease [Argonema galeatum]|uniref:Uma2 family endonuclease n=1 Tax=Argonema galeatum TaxID=2942762 RepID=UPI0020127793|nr:Uma2 family endonuclease [Argonema galeatum]MCL1468283.1 Uma2 family endonuclease [Argonema galeatum A003/A1]
MFATTLAINEYIIDIKPDLTKIEKGVMIQAIPTIVTTVTFDEFIAWYPQASGCHYELRSGEIVEMPKPTGKHSRVAGFTALKAGIEIERLKLPYFIPKECVIKSVRDDSGYEPDVIVLDERSIADSPRCEKESIITRGTSVRLIVEVEIFVKKPHIPIAFCILAVILCLRSLPPKKPGFSKKPGF